ncbi:FMN-binding protein [Sinomonas sp. ASV322]|uniref:FMN-binding protein n=1 Tax=Sinomonas sp. ASV322 TaxID=3041920 RepID=UPI0027DEA18D|nr:FMN-binding protein [Sinomonas sp. ASV322]MDQ4502037.1 FMN-binding protein [Sinomonas sp. ASV322]
MPMPSAPIHRPRPLPARKLVLTALAGASLAGTIAGCAPSAANAGQAGGAGSQLTTTPTTAAASGGTSGSSGSHAYHDGTFSADGHYSSPNGPETVGVTLTLKSGVVTDVQITEHPTSANTRLFQKHFASGIKDVVVGKKLDDLNVSIVAGSSLTGQGFNDAVSIIKNEAS